METFTPEEFWAKLEETGEETVRIRVATGGVYGTGNKKQQLAEEWLRKKDQERRRAEDAIQTSIATEAKDAALVAAKAASVAADEARAQSELARDANTIARDANILARQANTRATIAIAVAIVAVIASTLISWAFRGS